MFWIYAGWIVAAMTHKFSDWYFRFVKNLPSNPMRPRRPSGGIPIDYSISITVFCSNPNPTIRVSDQRILAYFFIEAIF